MTKLTAILGLVTVEGSCHYCNNDKYSYSYKTISEEIMVGNSSTIVARKLKTLDALFSGNF